jgi:ABC-2 type transport system permease protein
MFAALSLNEWVTLAGLGVAVLVVAGVMVYLCLGLFQARSLIRRELAAYFTSPIAYVVFVVFLAVTGSLFAETLNKLTAKGSVGVEYPLQAMFDDNYFWLIFLAIPPLLTMRSFAEERASGTLELLMTAPLRDWQVVLSKYVACFVLYLLVWLPTLVYLPALLDLSFRPARLEDLTSPRSAVWTWSSLALVVGLVLTLVGAVLLLPRLGTRGRLVSLGLVLGGVVLAGAGGWSHYTRDHREAPAAQAAEVVGLLATPQGAGPLLVATTEIARPPLHLVEVRAGLDPVQALTFYLGVTLAGAMFLALGLLVSSLVRDQLVAALIALALSLLFVVERFWRVDTDAGGAFDRFVYFFSVPLHFQKSFSLGLLDTRHIVLYASVAVFCLFLTVRSLESRRWR